MLLVEQGRLEIPDRVFPAGKENNLSNHIVSNFSTFLEILLPSTILDDVKEENTKNNFCQRFTECFFSKDLL